MAIFSLDIRIVATDYSLRPGSIRCPDVKVVDILDSVPTLLYVILILMINDREFDIYEINEKLQSKGYEPLKSD